jgi:hypothetical protein
MDPDTFFHLSTRANIKATEARMTAAVEILFQKAPLLKYFGSKLEHVYAAFIDVSGFAWCCRFTARHGFSLFFQRFGDKERVGGALGGEFAAVDTVWIVNTVGAVLAAIQAEGVGDGIEIVRVGAGDTKKGAVRRN